MSPSRSAAAQPRGGAARPAQSCAWPLDGRGTSNGAEHASRLSTALATFRFFSLVATGAGVAGCSVTYVPGASGVPTRTDTITATYVPDPTHTASSGTCEVRKYSCTAGYNSTLEL